MRKCPEYPKPDWIRKRLMAFGGLHGRLPGKPSDQHIEAARLRNLPCHDVGEFKRISFLVATKYFNLF